LLSDNTKDTISPERISATRGAHERFQDFNLWIIIYVFAFPLKADIEKAPENLQIELTNLQCDNLNQKFSETKLQDFYSYLPK
jgi:hypothetical protein